VHLKSSVEIKTELDTEIQNREQKGNRKYKKKEKRTYVLLSMGLSHRTSHFSLRSLQ
jgi:hypothetical protein